jgi:hypothetical protein
MRHGTLIATLLLASLPTQLAAKPAAPKARQPQLVSAQFDCDALSIDRPIDAATARDLIPAHSLDAAAAVLTKHGVKFARSQGIMTLDGIPQRIVHDINVLPQGEPVILPNGQGSVICVLRPSADSI